MIRFRNSLLKIMIIAILAGAICMSSPLQDSRALYLVQGLAARTTFNVGSAVYRVDPSSRTVVPVSSLVDPNAGIDFLLADHERRVVVAGTPFGRPEKVVILNMDAPQSPRVVPISVDGVVEASIFGRPDGSVHVALEIFRDGVSSLKGVDLLSAGAGTAAVDLPWTNYRYQRSEGWWSPGDESSREFILHPKDGGATVWRGGVQVDTGIDLPKNVSADEDKRLSVAVNNDAIIVVERRKERGEGKDGPAGKARLSIYDKKSQRWRNEDFAGVGGATSIRAFGPWVIVNEGEARRDLSGSVTVNNNDRNLKVSAGSASRQKPVNPGSPDAIPVDYLFQASPVYFRGTIHLFDAQSGERYRIDTGQGDTEVLLVDGTTVYYRVNDVLYRAQIAKGKPNLQGVEFAKDDNIQLAHWAFLGR